MGIIDYAVVQDNQGNFDLSIDTVNNEFKGVSGNDTAIPYQLFLDRRASKKQVYNPRARQGWIGDILTKQNNYEAGSFVYLKSQARFTQSDMNQIAGYAKDALKYFTQTGQAQKISVSVVGKNLTGVITVDGSNNNPYSYLWNNIGQPNP